MPKLLLYNTTNKHYQPTSSHGTQNFLNTDPKMASPQNSNYPDSTSTFENKIGFPIFGYWIPSIPSRDREGGVSRLKSPEILGIQVTYYTYLHIPYSYYKLTKWHGNGMRNSNRLRMTGSLRPYRTLSVLVIRMSRSELV